MKLSKHASMKVIKHGKLYEPISTISEVQFCPECGHEENSCVGSYEGMTFFGHKYTDFHCHWTCRKCKCHWEMNEKIKKNEWNKHRVLAIVLAVLASISFVLAFTFFELFRYYKCPSGDLNVYFRDIFHNPLLR